MDEIWKPIKGYEGRYEVSNLGRVKSIDFITRSYWAGFRQMKGRILKLTVNARGYLRCALCSNNIKTKEVHRLVAIAFIEKPIGLNCVNHKNGIKIDNRVENLEWCTMAYNNQHAQDTGLNKARFSEKQKKAASINGKKCRKITIEQAEIVRRIRENTNFGSRRISRITGLNKRSIDSVIYKNRYKE